MTPRSITLPSSRSNTHFSTWSSTEKFFSNSRDASGGDYGFKVDKIEYVLP